ncbi:hypothetical protein ACFYTF_24595 [Nocardia thailandica]|uniref:Uncharacterized protein n=1 Tax=Nocardia thailandica TaxID=257275 RepID=A0ABW6PUB9_9NOCA
MKRGLLWVSIPTIANVEHARTLPGKAEVTRWREACRASPDRSRLLRELTLLHLDRARLRKIQDRHQLLFRTHA